MCHSRLSGRFLLIRFPDVTLIATLVAYPVDLVFLQFLRLLDPKLGGLDKYEDLI